MPPQSTPSSAHLLAHLNSVQAILLLGGIGTLASLWSDLLFPAIMSLCSTTAAQVPSPLPSAQLHVEAHRLHLAPKRQRTA